MNSRPILPGISSPKEIKSLSIEQLQSLSSEIHHRIIEVMAINGGHLASNLGVIDLTLALHKVFRSPEDIFLFDVSHQTYTHKIVTGRNNEFPTIRKFEGLSGFAHPEESDHDHFYAGHAGTALSLALGMAKARDLEKRDNYIITILGDASLTCGHTLEALNNIDKGLRNFIIILNDNAMSIAKNVGNVPGILTRLIHNPLTHRMSQEFTNVVKKIPGCGEFLKNQSLRIKEFIKQSFPLSPFFEEFGLEYVGPIDGHDIKQVIHTLTSLQSLAMPIILHVTTEKGRGMTAAQNNPITYHGVKPFDIKTGKFLPTLGKQPTFSKIFGNYLLELAKARDEIIAITPAMPVGSCITDFMEHYPDRCIDVGIAEGHCLAFAAGIAKSRGKRVFCCIYATFLQRAFDQLFQEICLQNLPVIFAIDRAGIAGGDGITHNGIYDLGFMRAMSNLIIAQPRNGQVLCELLRLALNATTPIAIRYPNLPTTKATEPLTPREIGKGEILVSGKDVAIIALGHKCDTALEIATILEREGIYPTILDPIFVQPLDRELLHTILQKHSHIITLEEHHISVGLGSAINDFASKGSYSVSMYNFGIEHSFMQHGSHAELTRSIGLDAESLATQILSLVKVEVSV